jgi:hypothetical protein
LDEVEYGQCIKEIWILGVDGSGLLVQLNHLGIHGLHLVYGEVIDVVIRRYNHWVYLDHPILGVTDHPLL